MMAIRLLKLLLSLKDEWTILRKHLAIQIHYKPAIISVNEENQYVQVVTLQEVKDAISRLKNDKAAGKDKMSAEMPKTDDINIPKKIHNILQSKTTPNNGKRRTIIKNSTIA